MSCCSYVLQHVLNGYDKGCYYIIMNLQHTVVATFKATPQHSSESEVHAPDLLTSGRRGYSSQGLPAAG